MDLEHKIMVPIAQTWLAPGSAVIVYERGSLTFADFEGNIYDAENLRVFADRALSAYDRALTSYPTTARCAIDTSLFKEVGHLDPINGRVVVTDRATLKEWLQVQDLEPELLCTSHKFRRQR